MAKDWFDKHVVVMTLDDDKKKEKAIKSALKKQLVKKFTKSKKKKDKPVEGKTYALTGLGKCIANGNTWKESEVKN